MSFPFDPRPDGVEVQVGADPLLALELIPDLLDSVGAAEGDPAVRRLTPSAYPDDQEAQEEYGRMINPELERERKADRRILNDLLAARERVAVSGGKGQKTEAPWTKALSAEDAEGLLRVMNESRLTLAARLGIEDESWEKPPESPDQEAPHLMLLRYLTYLQEALIEALTVPSD